MPLWQIRAERITHDQVEKEFIFEGASFEFLGRQVLYLPYFSQADPTVPHKSGFLLPDIGSSTYLGSFVKIPVLHLAQSFAGPHDRSAHHDESGRSAANRIPPALERRRAVVAEHGRL